MASILEIKTLASSSEGNCHLLILEHTKVLLDCGIPYSTLILKLQEIGISITDIDICLVSHEHLDHSLSMDKLKNFILCYNPSNLTNFNVLNIKDIMITPIPLKHGKIENNAYLMETEEGNILYATDFSLCEYKIDTPIDYLMVECNYIEHEIKGYSDYKTIRQISTHMGLDSLIFHLHNVFNISRCKEIYLLHLSDKYSDEEVMKSTISTIFKIKTYICNKKGGVK